MHSWGTLGAWSKTNERSNSLKLSITTHRIIFALESVLVLLPITVIAFIGGSYLLLIMLGQELFSVPVKALGISVTTVIGMVGLIALWVLVVQALSQFQLLGRKTEKRIRRWLAGIAPLCAFSLFATRSRSGRERRFVVGVIADSNLRRGGYGLK